MTIQEFQEDLKSQISLSNQYPASTRSCTDLLCLIFFMFLLLFFFCFGAVIIHQGVQSYHHDPYVIESKYYTIRYKIPLFIEIVCSMTAFGVVFTCIYFFLLRRYPKCILFASMIFATLLLMILVVVSYAYKHHVIGTLTLIGLGIFALSLFCSFRSHLKSTLTILELGVQFLKSSSKIFSVPLTIGAVGLIFSFFLIGFYAAIIQLHAANKYSRETASALMALMGVIYLIFLLIFYHIIVFLISSSALFWYFSTQITSRAMGMRWLSKYHFGSIIYASLTQPIANVLSIIVDLSEGNGCFARTMQKVGNCFLSFKLIVHTLNHFGVSLIPITGDNLTKSAQNAAVLYYDNRSLYEVVRKLRFFMLTSGIFLTISLPTLVGVMIGQSYGLGGIINILGITIMLSISLVSVIFTASIVQGISSVFTYFCFDRKLSEYGVNISHVQHSIKDVYQEIYLQHKQYNKEDERGTVNPLDDAKSPE